MEGQERGKNPIFVCNFCVEPNLCIKFALLEEHGLIIVIFLTISCFSVVTFETLSDDYSKVCLIVLVGTGHP